MRDLRDKVTVITGAASGFGRELAIQCAAEGMHVVLADVDAEGMAGTLARLPAGTQALVVPCDVSQAEQVEALARRTYERFGAAHLLFNNAGVLTLGPVWTTTPEDWQWTLGINLMGVVHGIRSFVPRMLESGAPAHIVNTASAAGLVSVPGSSVYCVSKHAVVTLSECLYAELQAQQAAIGVSLLCPAFVPTAIADSARHRPADLAAANPLAASYEAQARQAIQSGRLTAVDVARITLEAVRAGRFYVLTHPKIKRAVETRMRDILDERNPTDAMQP